MANDNDNDNKDSWTKVLLPWVQRIITVAAAVGAPSASFVGLAWFVGRQYQRSYYDTLGIPFDLLSYSREDYALSFTPSAVFAVAPVVGALLGVILAVTLHREEVPGTLKELVKGKVVPNAGSGREREFNLFRALAANLLPLSAVVLFWAVLIWGYDDPVFLSIVAAFLAFWLSLPATLLVRRRLHDKDPSNDGLYLGLGSAALLIALALGLLLVPPHLGEQKARDHWEDHLGDLPGVNLLVNGSAGLAGDREEPVIVGEVEGPIPKDCPPFKSNDDAPAVLCRVTDAVLIAHNNGRYWITEDNKDEKGRGIHSVPDARVVDIAFEPPLSRFD